MKRIILNITRKSLHITILVLLVSPILLSQELDFGNATNYVVGEEPRSIVIQDFDGDSNLDIITSNKVTDNISLLIGNGDGTFNSQVTFDVGDAPNEIIEADFDNDGFNDIATANKTSKDITVLLGDGAGSFSPKSTYSVNGTPYGLCQGDFNNDSLIDLAIASENEGIEVLLGTGNGEFGSPKTYSTTGCCEWDIVAADFNGDNELDLAVTHYGFQYGVSVLLGNGNGTFATAKNITAGDWPLSLAAKDLNGDSTIDLVITNGYNLSIHMGNGDGTFGDEQIFGDDDNTLGVVIEDMNFDGIPELILANQNNINSNGSMAILNGASFNNYTTDVKLDAGMYTIAVATGDLNNDNLPDVVVTNWGSDDVYIFINNTSIPNGINDIQIGAACSGTYEGSISFNVIGGTSPYQFSWTSNVSQGDSASNLWSGTYTVTIIDVNNNMFINSFIVPNFPKANVSFVHQISNELVVKFYDSSYSDIDTISSWIWDFGDGTTDSILRNPEHTYDNYGSYTANLFVTTVNGCEFRVGTILKLWPTSLNEAGQFYEFQIYPNPNSGIFVLEIELQAKTNLLIQLTNITGQITYSESVNASSYKKDIDLSGYAKGVYALKVVSDVGVVTRKVVYR